METSPPLLADMMLPVQRRRARKSRSKVVISDELSGGCDGMPGGSGEVPDDDASEVDGDHSDYGPIVEQPGPPQTDRRSAIKKAAAAAATVGAVWSAPRVEGFSLVPDYAAAGTFAGTVVSNFVYQPGPFTTDWWGPGPGGGTKAKTYPTPGGPVTVQINGPQLADSGAPVPVSLLFAMDPPHNRLAGGFFNFRGRNAPGGRNGPHPGGPLVPYIPALPRQTNNPTGPSIPVSFTIPQAVNNVGPSPTANTQWADITFTFNFNNT